MQILFFALREDLLPILQFAEAKGALRYFLMGNFTREEINGGLAAFDSGASIANLGVADSDSSVACESYLVCERKTQLNLRILQNNFERVCVDQLANQDSVEFKPGGIWNEDVILNGRIATASNSQISQALMKRFQVAIKKNFSKVKAFYVGPNALVRLENGARLTGAVRSPREFDLISGNGPQPFSETGTFER